MQQTVVGGSVLLDFSGAISLEDDTYDYLSLLTPMLLLFVVVPRGGNAVMDHDPNALFTILVGF